MANKTTTILNLPFVNTSFKLFIDQLVNNISNHKNTFVVTANPEIAYYAHRYPEYSKIVQSASYITPDGIGIVKAAHILNLPMAERISGYDIFIELLKWGNQNHKSAYFLGATADVISDLEKNVAKQYPNLQICGYHDGYFKDDQSIVNIINDKKPDMVFVALGSPKQEKFIYHHREITNGLWIGLGGSFDVLAGHVNRAPSFWVNHHLEWLYRTIKQPKRIVRIAKMTPFIKLIYQQKHFQNKSR